MRSRMVPFSRIVPRLRRMVRQISMELDKKAELILENTEGEMDRALLESMLPPFEHMLRNALDHGIEDREKRGALGKNETGKIIIALERQGGEVVIRLSDDGRGIDYNAVREKAVTRGLIHADAIVTENEALHFIMQPGFSTAEKVTQISGRGVGMDVVNSEIKNLGGSLDLTSNVGQGTEFEVRLPFTVSVNRALLVSVGGEQYALPLNTIEGVARISPDELAAFYADGSKQFEYGGEGYQVRYMGEYIHIGRTPNLEGITEPLPVILVRGGEYRFAVQVDSIQGSREVVVKNLGLQFNAVPGLSGATVMGDGSVVVILDVLALIRISEVQRAQGIMVGSEDGRVEKKRAQLVMVVDDSVTVRKVSSRLLERNGRDVLLAKDGAEAVQMLQTHKPDVMLLDIEMPRMDGFELATIIRHDDHLKDLPIIMITSRTGEKHRERAAQIGVNQYMGKPYNEVDLLESISALLPIMS